MYEKIRLDSLMKGALEQKFQYELDKISENIADPNTESKAVREITIKIKFNVNEERDQIGTTASISSKLAPIKDSAQILSFAQQNGKYGLFHETSKDIPLFTDEDRKIDIGAVNQ